MANPFGGGGGPRRVVDPSGAAGRSRWRPEGVDACAGQPQLTGRRRCRQLNGDGLKAPVRGQGPRQPAVIESMPKIRYHKKFRGQLRGNEADLMLTQYRNDRIL